MERFASKEEPFCSTSGSYAQPTRSSGTSQPLLAVGNGHRSDGSNRPLSNLDRHLFLITQSKMKLNKIFSDQIPALSEKEEDLLHQVKNTRTTPRDHRFPSHNQALHCWNRYNEWLVCLKQTGGDDDKCQAYRQYSLSICPGNWIENWDEAREENRFMGVKN